MEQRINKYLDEQGVDLTNPHQKELDFYEKRKQEAFQKVQEELDGLIILDVFHKTRSLSTSFTQLKVNNSKLYQKRKYTE